MKRAVFEFKSTVDKWGKDPDGELEVTSGEQGVTFSVTDDCAYNSYNIETTCATILPRVEAERLASVAIECLINNIQADAITLGVSWPFPTEATDDPY